MRDVEKLREKVEISLDDKQIAGLAVAALMLLAGVFALGLMVGKNLALRAPQAQPVGELTQLDEQQKHAPPPPAEKPAEKPVKVAAPEVQTAAVAAPEPPVKEVAPPPQKPLVVDPPKPVAVQKAQTLELTAPPKDLGAFTIQIGASQQKTEAQRLEAKARGAGLKPYVVEANLGAKGTWYRVRVGSFKDKDSANRFRKDVERELRVSAVVMPAR